MEGCLFYLFAIGINMDSNDTPRDIEVFDCKTELRFFVEKKEVFVYDFVESDDLYIYSSSN